MRSLGSRIALGFLLPATVGMAAPPAMKDNPTPVVYRISGHKQRFLHYPERFMTISETCRRKKNRISCDAYDALGRASYARLPADDAKRRGSDAGASLCINLGGAPVLAHDEKENENLVCEFRDHSMATTGSLDAHAIIHERAGAGD